LVRARIRPVSGRAQVTGVLNRVKVHDSFVPGAGANDLVSHTGPDAGRWLCSAAHAGVGRLVRRASERVLAGDTLL